MEQKSIKWGKILFNYHLSIATYKPSERKTLGILFDVFIKNMHNQTCL